MKATQEANGFRPVTLVIDKAEDLILMRFLAMAARDEITVRGAVSNHMRSAGRPADDALVQTDRIHEFGDELYDALRNAKV